MGLCFDEDEVKEKLSMARDLLQLGKADSDSVAVRLYSEMVCAGVSRAAVELADHFLMLFELPGDRQIKKQLLDQAWDVVCSGIEIENNPDTDSPMTLVAMMAYMNQLELACEKNPDTTMEAVCMVYNYLQADDSGEYEETDAHLKTLMCHYASIALFSYDHDDFDEETDDLHEIERMLIYLCENTFEDDDKVKLIQAYFYLDIKHHNESLRDIDKAIEILQGMDDVDAFFTLGIIYSCDEEYGKEDLDKAIFYFIKAGDAGHEHGYRYAAVCLGRRGRSKEAVEYYIKAIEIGDRECIKWLEQTHERISIRSEVVEHYLNSKR